VRVLTVCLNRRPMEGLLMLLTESSSYVCLWVSEGSHHRHAITHVAAFPLLVPTCLSAMWLSSSNSSSEASC
jgi:hypothetical protein